MRKRGRTVLRIAMTLIISVTLGGSVYLWNARSLGGNEMPMPFGIGLSVVLSGSMEPTLLVNDLVVIREAEAYVPGDVVVYQSGRVLVIHRLLETDGTTALTKGDANDTADEPIPTYLIKGKMVGRVPGVGAAVEVLKSTPGTVAVIALAAFLMIRSRRRDREDARAEQDAIREQIEALKEQLEREETTAAQQGPAAEPAKAPQEDAEAQEERTIEEDRKE